VRRLASVAVLSTLAYAADPLDSARLEAIHAQRLDWMKKRVALPPQGVYFDFRAVTAGAVLSDVLKVAKQADVQVVFAEGAAASSVHDGILVVPPPRALPHFDEPARPWAEVKNRRELKDRLARFPEETIDIAGPEAVTGHEVEILRRTSVHILARELGAVPASIDQGRTYVAHDWLCDPAGFFFVAENSFGAYEIGDNVPLMNGATLTVNLPVPGSIRLLHDGKPVAEKEDSRLVFHVKDLGVYRAEVSLNLGGEQRPWIQTGAIRVSKPSFIMPMGEPSAGVEVRKDLAYIDDGQPKHKLDLYLPKGAKNFRVLLFVHGGAWHSGDRSHYGAIGDRFARAGIGVAIPSYRLMPQNPHPAQIEDAAAAFSWVQRNIGQFGGDPSRIYVAGHSAGGHLVSLLALDPRWLKKYDLTPAAIRGVVTLSGVYDVDAMAQFKDRHASPMEFIHPHMPPFLISYCQWDYFGLPKQARDFATAVKKDFGDAKLIYVPAESHISEVIALLKDDDPLARIIVDFINK
jgi:acetyl esterase/lipase